MNHDRFNHAGSGMESGGGLPSSDVSAAAAASKRRSRFPVLTGETNKGSIEALVKSTGKESLQWGLAAGMYSGLTYGLKEARGTHDWKNSAVAGAITGAALSMMTTDNTTHEQVVQCAITGAAISTVANFMKGIF
ncbi:outer envelope pore protein 16-2, chloroplastic-like [Impatiens glandulifera]|uniref:outer envelope pore protein 16-2, chloroplastic-like n=1 Tax=Impatiens glandulifera TaxID=253017 RepID=UPI001FB10876|nr:outer envelope pore protein 16-2, chloroplastic-like [Impatiens glandulifera]